MEQSKSKQCESQLLGTQTIKNQRTEKSDTSSYNLTRKRSISSLKKKQRSISPVPLNFKQKHLMYQKDLLTQKFKNLHLNQINKHQKKPLKLKLEKINKQNNIIVINQLNGISNALEIKLQAQNQLLKKSLEKMQKLVTISIKKHPIQKKESMKIINYHQKLPEIIQNQSQKQLKNKLSQLKEQKDQLEQQIKKMKTLNNFLTSQNYKLSMQNSMLKQRIIEQQQADYQNAMKTSCNQDNITLLNEQENNYEQKNKFLQSEQQRKRDRQSQNSFSEDKKTQKCITQFIQAQNFTLKGKQVDDAQEQSYIQIKEILRENSDGQDRVNQGHLTNLQQEFRKLVGKINDLQQQLQDQKFTNDLLSNQIASLKLNNYEPNTKNDRLDESVQSNVSIQMQINKVKRESYSKQSLNKDIINQSVKKIQNQLIHLSFKGIKSNISNKIIYFAQAISKEQQKQQKQQKITAQRKDKKDNQNSQKYIKNSFKFIRRQADEYQKRKTQCMKNIQVPAANQIQKRRKGICQILNSSSLKKPVPVKNTLSFYSNKKINHLQIIRQTISLKFEAFKYTFVLLQNQMILWPTRKAKYVELKSILEEYPFFLDEESILILLNYCDITQGKQINVDQFCSKLRQFIKQYDEPTQQQEVILQRKIYKRWKYTKEQIMDALKKNQTGPGQIRKEQFVAVLSEFKFQENQIHHLLCQNVAVSSNIYHIKYREYFEKFFTQR